MSSRTLAKSAIGFSRMATGTYTGNGAATQAIIGIGFQPKFVIVYRKADATYDIGLNRDGTEAKFFDFPVSTWRYETDQIVSLDADGFTVGDGTPLGVNVFNILATNYTYIAFG